MFSKEQGLSGIGQPQKKSGDPGQAVISGFVIHKGQIMFTGC